MDWKKTIKVLLVAILGSLVLAPLVLESQERPNNGGGGGGGSDPTALKKASNLSDVASKSAAAQNVGVLDMASDSGISAPEYAFTNSTAKFANQLGITRNSGATAFYIARSTTKGDWLGNAMFNGTFQVGTEYHNTNATSSDVALTVIGNGNTNFISNSGPAGGSELTMVVKQMDPRQAAYINFSSPSAVSMPARTVTMSNPANFQIGLGGYLYGANTLGGLPIKNDGLITLNLPSNLIMTSTVNKGTNGCRSFFQYDNTNSVVHFPVSVAGNGVIGTPGYATVLIIDEVNKAITSTNATVSLTGGTVVLGPSGTFQVNGANDIQIGAGGTANTGLISGGKLSVNTAGTLGAPSLLNRAGSKFQYLNWDSSGGSQLGKFADGSFANDVDLALDNGHTGVHLNRPTLIQSAASAFTTPATCAVLELNSTTKGLLLPRMSKTERDNISSKVAGLAIYQTDNTPGLRVFNGTSWMRYTETAD